MKLIGFNFQKISIEKFTELPENVKFNLKLDITSIDSAKSDILKLKEDLIKLDFFYNVFYEPNIAKIELAGNMILAVESRIARDLLKGWKDKQVSEEFRLFVFNVILRKSNIKALQLGEEMGLPPHIPMPALGKENFKPKEEGTSSN